MLLFAVLFSCVMPGTNDDVIGDTASFADTASFVEIPDFPQGVSTLAGSDEMASIDGIGDAAAFHEPKSIALGDDGILVVVGGDGAIRLVSMDGSVQTWSFEGATLTDAGGLAVDESGAMYVSDPQQHCIVRVDGRLGEVFAGTCGESGMMDGADALFTRPRGLAFDAQGNLLVADSENMRIRSISPNGTVSTVAGVDGFGGPTEGSVSTAALYFPLDLAVHQNGDVYFSGLDNCIRRIHDGQVENIAGLCQNYSSDGSADGVAGDARFYGPFDIAFLDEDTLIVSDSFNDRLRMLSLDTQTVTTLTGEGTGYLDGALDQALFSVPRSVAVDRLGNVFVADSVNHRIRVVVP